MFRMLKWKKMHKIICASIKLNGSNYLSPSFQFLHFFFASVPLKITKVIDVLPVQANKFNGSNVTAVTGTGLVSQSAVQGY